PFWWAALRVRTRRLLKRSSQRPGQSMNVLVNAVSGRAMIADFAPVGTAVTAQQWSALLDEHGDRSRLPSRSEADRAARALARAEVVRTVKLGMGIDISPANGHGLRGLLKPNWLVTGGEREALGDDPRRRTRLVPFHRASREAQPQFLASVMQKGWPAGSMSTTQVSPGCGSAREAPSSTQRAAAASRSSAARSRWNCLCPSSGQFGGR